MKNLKNITGFRHGSTLLVFLFFLLLTATSCKKYLEAKPDQTITTPTTLDDVKGILDNYSIMNSRYPSASEVSADDFYLTSSNWASLTDRQRNFYNWQKFDDIGADYTSPYTAIFAANIMLETLDKIDDEDASAKRNYRGSAYFIRGAYHYALTQLFAPPYDQSTANTDLGIALRLHSDISIIPVRSTVSQSYAAILDDLKKSVPLLPASITLKYRPSKAAAYGLIARVCLAMRDYQQAGLYADSCLNLYSTLINYNTVDASAIIPFKQFNEEVIYDARTSPPAALSPSKAKIDTVLYAGYNANDLRRAIFFKSGTNGSKAFKGNYTGLSNASCFTGIATDEMFLIRAEAAVRQGNINSALTDLNKLLTARFKTGSYAPYTTGDQAALLLTILQERRKELLYRTLRWTDLRRLNKEQNLSRTISRSLNSVLYTLPPNNARYTFEIDRNAVLVSGLTQNP